MGLKLNIKGQTFGRLTAIEELPERKNGAIVWLFQCSCGKQHKATATAVKNGSIQSCGCAQKEAASKLALDLLGQRFGKLLVIEKTEKRRDRSVVWKCQCDCGNIIEVDSHSLRKGNTQSCGCLKSRGEQKIIQLLQKMKIQYEYQKIFDDCKLTQNLSFDFFLPEYNTCIEYNGEQHYFPIDTFGGEEKFIMQQKRDKIKKDWCIKNNINLIIISYLDYNKLDENYIQEKLLYL